MVGADSLSGFTTELTDASKLDNEVKDDNEIAGAGTVVGVPLPEGTVVLTTPALMRFWNRALMSAAAGGATCCTGNGVAELTFTGAEYVFADWLATPGYVGGGGTTGGAEANTGCVGGTMGGKGGAAEAVLRARFLN